MKCIIGHILQMKSKPCVARRITNLNQLFIMHYLGLGSSCVRARVRVVDEVFDKAY